MMTGHGEKPPLLKDSEVITYADRHSGTVGTQPGVLNPYKMGLELFRDIEERWNKGKFGKDYDECDDLREREKWDLDLRRGREKIFEVRKTHNDVTFIDNFLTPEFCWEQKLFVYDYNKNSYRHEISDREFNKIKKKLLFQLTNAGQPFIFVENGNHNNRGELLLVHRHEGFDLDLEAAKATLVNVQQIWSRPVYLSTIVEEKERTLSFDGNAHSESS
jgi:stage V sporulation protein R